MNLVLAVEPDPKQAEALRRILKGQHATELIIVTSAYAATTMMKRRVPDLVLLGASLGPKAQEIVDIFSLVSDAPETLTIPPLAAPAAQSRRGGSSTRTPDPDPKVFAAQVATCLVQLAERRAKLRSFEARLQQPVPQSKLPTSPLVGPEKPESQREPISAAASIRRLDTTSDSTSQTNNALGGRVAEEPGPASPPPDDRSVVINLNALPDDRAGIDPHVYEAHVALVQARAEARLAAELERVRREAEQQRAAELARLREEAEAERRAAVEEARAAVAIEARDALAADLARIRNESDQTLAAELARVRGEAAQRLEQQLAEADVARAAAVEEARTASEQAAAQALETEVARIQHQSDARLAAALAHAHEEAAAARRAHEQAQQDMASEVDAAARQARAAAEESAARALEDEVLRIRQESDARLAAELARAHEEAAAARRAQQEAQIELEAARETAAHEARAAAEAAWARALDAEVARVRDEADARLEQELARTRAEMEKARAAREQAQLEAEAEREAAVREALAAADAAAARAHEEEIARVRADAEARLQAELARARAQAEHMQPPDESEIEQIRRNADMEARALAEATIIRRTARAREEADARITAEVEQVRAEADRQRATELAAMQAQLARMQEDARAYGEAQQARSAADVEEIRRQADIDAMALADAALEREIARAREEAEARIAAEVAHVRAEVERQRATDLAAMRAELARMQEQAREHASASAEAAGVHAPPPAAASASSPHIPHVDESTSNTAVPASVGMIHAVWQRVPPRTVPVAGALLALAAAVALVPVSTVSGGITSLRQSIFAAASTAFMGTTRAVRGALTANERSVTVAPQANAAADNPQQPDASSEVSVPGTLTVFSRVPLELYVSNRRIGTTEDDQILLPAGRYRIDLVSTRLNYRGQVTLVVRPGAVTAHTVSLPDGRVQVNTEPGAEVSVEGIPAGEAPLAPLPVPIGTREILVRHPELGERRESVEVRYGEIVEVNITRR
jgi:hypothetical protein